MLCDLQAPTPLLLGRQGESDVVTIRIDVSAMYAWDPQAAVYLLHKRSGDAGPYPAVTTIEGNTLVWPVTKIDTLYPGYGEAEVQAIRGDGTKKSVILNTFVAASLSGDVGNPTEPVQNWVEQLLEAGSEVSVIANEFSGLSATAVALPAGSEPTVMRKIGADGKPYIEYGIPSGGGGGGGGQDGATFTPSVSSSGELSWTNDKGLPNPPSVNIKGPRGESPSNEEIITGVLAALPTWNGGSF